MLQIYFATFSAELVEIIGENTDGVHEIFRAVNLRNPFKV
jgi:hypothetical protein